MGDTKITGSLIADGCRIGHNVTISNSVIGLRTVVGDNVVIKDSVVMGADFMDDPTKLADGTLPVGIGSGSTISGTILDKNCRIGSNVQILNKSGVENQGEDDVLQVRDGIPIVIKNGQIEDGFTF